MLYEPTGGFVLLFFYFFLIATKEIFSPFVFPVFFVSCVQKQQGRILLRTTTPQRPTTTTTKDTNHTDPQRSISTNISATLKSIKPAASPHAAAPETAAPNQQHFSQQQRNTEKH